MSAPRVQVYAARVVHLPPAQFAGRICAARLDALQTIVTEECGVPAERQELIAK